MNDRSLQLLQLVARVIAPLPNKLSIAGHTDATPFQGRIDYSNWELSTDRANAARRALVNSGVDESRVQNVSGKADTDPMIKTDPLSPENRRISIVLLRETPPGGAGAQPTGATPPPGSSPPAATTPAGSAPPAAPGQSSALPPELIPSTPIAPATLVAPPAP
jgi:chemotaxis protein MotB